MEAANEWLTGYVQAHNQRQLSTQLSCPFECLAIQIHPGQSGAPNGRAQVDIVEFADGRLALLYRGTVLQHSRS